jgi:uncharacterized metal-binding protein YceD (DUF177 family)
VDLQRTESMLDLHFHIVGTIELVCDRSLERFDYPLDIREELILKFGDRTEELDDNMSMIPWDLPVLNVAGYVYELITVAVPLKKLHPRFKDIEEDTSDELVYSSKKKDEEFGDPRWEILKKLRSKSNSK